MKTEVASKAGNDPQGKVPGTSVLQLHGTELCQGELRNTFIPRAARKNVALLATHFLTCEI